MILIVLVEYYNIIITENNNYIAASSSQVLQGCLIPILNITLIELSTTTYLRYSFLLRLILRLNLLHHSCKSFLSKPVPKPVSLTDVYYTSPGNNHFSEYSSNGSSLVLRYQSARWLIFFSSQKRETSR